MSDLLLVFLKWPEPGGAKTRLIPALGPAAAAELYAVLAEAVVRRTAPEAGEYQRLFCFTPAEKRRELGLWFPAEELRPQAGADLGARMAEAFAEGFRRGATRVAVIGTDVPGVTRARVVEAFRALCDHDLVLGPARDGGYYLLALRAPRPELFQDVAWGTPEVLSTTLERAARYGLRAHAVESLIDVDTLEDLRALGQGLEPLLAPRPGLRDAVREALAARPLATESSA